ncbi:MAG: FeoB-associated Cys-rich membrane protein [Clostridia bacterium]|nr:FeoB-associated Cys-rich membrane protein [Clostridia bacterium]MEE1024655.1 FeoB-associated Cys-rich membrane protein [Acutalibacteraceae bacterium]
MFAWIVENIGTIVVCAVLIGVVALIITIMVRNKKKGKSSCSCGCSGCAMSEHCHSKK